MADARVEMVVGGRRRAALSTSPLLGGPAFLGSGFVMEEHDMSTFELPDHWIPNYLVTFQQSTRSAKRVVFEAGKERETIIESGAVDVVAPQEIRKFRFEGEARTTLLSIEPEVMRSMLASPPGGSSFELIRQWRGEDQMLLDLILGLRSEVQRDFAAGPFLAEQLCTKLAEELIQRYSIGKLKLDRYKGGLPGSKLSQAIEYIDSYLDHDLTTGDIGRAVGLSKYHFGKAFSTSTGMTLHNFVLARRMRRSRELLAGSDLPLAHVADAAGFSSQSHFTTVFLERTGITPGKYRSMHRPLSMVVGR